MPHHGSGRGWLRIGLASCLTMVVACVAFLAANHLPWSANIARAEVEEIPDEAPAPAQNAPAAAPGAAANNATDGPNKDEKLLAYLLRSLGWLYTIAFLSISFAFVALVVMNVLAARRENVAPLSLVDGFEAFLNEGKYQEAYELAKADESFLGHVLAAGLAKLNKGYDHAIEAMQEVGEEQNMRLEHRLSYIALIGTISPMVGLLGTVHGMIESFMIIASSTTTPPAYKLADGISTALVTTLVGLLIAIPAIGVFGILKNRVAQLVLEVGILSEELMSRFGVATAAKK